MSEPTPLHNKPKTNHNTQVPRRYQVTALDTTTAVFLQSRW